jgi:hypothetical protein
MISQDKLGCYRVGNLKFYSKLEAIEMHAKTGIHPHWDFNEAVFDSYDWTVEPKESLLELYRQRAEQLRNQYDHIILMYSGGGDSHTILQSFVDNNIHLDEVCSWINYQATGDKHSYMNHEIFVGAIPKVDHFKTKYPRIAHRLIDLTDITLDVLSENNKDWIYSRNHFFGPGTIARDNLAMKIEPWRDIIESGKKLCILWGKDKPRVHHIDGRFAVRFLDLIDDAVCSLSASGMQSYTDEFFYWTPDFVKILIKQAHLIKNYLSQPGFENFQFVTSNKTSLSYRVVDKKTYWLSIPGTHYLIYPNWDESLDFAPPKPQKTPMISPRDSWFYNISGHPAKDNLMIGLDKLQQYIPDYWKNDPSDWTAGIKGCWSKPYFLEK